MEEKLFSLPRAAKICAVSRWTLWSYVKSGELNGSRTPGGHYRISEKDLDAFILNRDMRPNNNRPGTSKKILIVDDDPKIRKFLLRVLSGNGCEVESASDGFETGQKSVQFKPDLVILDIFMPRMDGFEVCRRLKGNPETNHTKIIAISGDDSIENQQKIESCGADLFLAKPLSKKVILNKIDYLLKE
jgi:excisionase family DNA binding protein